jgi:hypothetical protein
MIWLPPGLVPSRTQKDRIDDCPSTAVAVKWIEVRLNWKLPSSWEVTVGAVRSSTTFAVVEVFVPLSAGSSNCHTLSDR